MTPYVLMLAAAAAHLAPSHVAAWRGDSAAAWEVVGYGIEASALWLAVASFAAKLAGTMAPLYQAVAAFGAFESVQRFSCRLAFPMNAAPPRIAGLNLCDIATGYSMTHLSTVAAGLCVYAASLYMRGGWNGSPSR